MPAPQGCSTLTFFSGGTGNGCNLGIDFPHSGSDLKSAPYLIADEKDIILIEISLSCIHWGNGQPCPFGKGENLKWQSESSGIDMKRASWRVSHQPCPQGKIATKNVTTQRLLDLPSSELACLFTIIANCKENKRYAEWLLIP